MAWVQQQAKKSDSYRVDCLSDVPRTGQRGTRRMTPGLRIDTCSPSSVFEQDCMLSYFVP